MLPLCKADHPIWATFIEYNKFRKRGSLKLPQIYMLGDTVRQSLVHLHHRLAAIQCSQKNPGLGAMGGLLHPPNAPLWVST